MARHWDTGSQWPTPVTRPEVPIPIYNHRVLPRGEEWMERGACVGRWPEWDHTIDGESPSEREARRRRAARVCRTACPVLASCRAWADRARTVGEFGVVAGRVTKGIDGSTHRMHWVEVREEGA